MLWGFTENPHDSTSTDYFTSFTDWLYAGSNFHSENPFTVIIDTFLTFAPVEASLSMSGDGK